MRATILGFLLVGCYGSHVPASQPAPDAGAWAGDAASTTSEPTCLEWAASEGSEYNDGAPEDLRCTRWSDGR